MADNIKIIGNINDIQRISRIKNEDQNLLNTQTINQTFGYNKDYIELFIYDLNQNLIYSNLDYKSFKSANNFSLNPNGSIPVIEIDPVNDIQSLNYISGEFLSQYNFFKLTSLDSSINLFIQEISDDRTEIRINSADIVSSDLIIRGESIIDSLTNSVEQKSFLLNQSNNIQILIVNAIIDENSQTPSILLKLYEPLPLNIDLKSTVWVTEEIIEPYVFNINLDTSIIPAPIPQLKGPNFDVDIDIKQNLGTKYENYSSLVSSLTGSSYRQVLNYMNDSSYDLNIDYTSFENFIHFSSAKKRLEIFFNKINQIESYDTDISTLLLSNSILKNEETASIKLKIDDITKNFDGFENYLYFESSSYTWPKTNNIKPYKNKFINKRFYQLTTSSIWNFTHSLNEIPTVIAIYSGSGQLLTTQSSVIGTNTLSLTFNNTTSSGYIILSSPSASTWYTNYTSSALLYDENNLDHLYNIAPAYVKNDPLNYQPYYDFTDMIGHYFDNIWIYITSINELYNADNNLEKGVSKDIVYDALRSLGVKLYNSKGDNDFEDYIGGSNSGSTLFTNDFSATSSYLNNVPKKDLLAETFKRIYHNIPLLSKTKGTSTGLQELITTFGVTSSIFSPNEFGGSNKKNQLKGYDNDKITIQNNTITGSVLSPFISLQQPFTASSDFTSTDLHFVDLSFSPQTELNSRVSASVAVTYPTFSIDEYIGDPRLLSSSSYDTLITQQNYFISASSAVSGSAKRLDYKGFIELVKYFDNSLFKMLKDFVPARTNALTGITIKSPVLERNKVPVYHPKVTEEITYDAKYSGPTITEDKTYHYNKVTNNKSSFYTGEFTGSYVNINNVFENSNPNPYIHPTNSIDINQFNHTDFNVTLNNVSSSVISNSRQKLEKIYTISNNYVFSSGLEYSSNAELQESNLSLKGYQNSRYEGTKISSLKFNTYSSASSTYSGDDSYGKTAVIDHNTRKIGLFAQITTNPYFNYPSRNNVFVKYLVDENGNLTELNKKNKNWVELQNIFKSGELLAVAQFDNSRNSDVPNQTQKSTDGNKPIYDSGYSYFPIMYASASQDTSLYFNYTGDTKSKLFKIKTSGGFINGSSSNKYPITNGNKIFKIFQKSTDIADPEFNDGNKYYLTSGSNPNTFSTYSIQETSKQRFNVKFDVAVEFPSINLSGSFTFNVNKLNPSAPPTVLTSSTLPIVSGFTSRMNTTYQYVKKTGMEDSLILPQDVKVYDLSGNYVEILSGSSVLRKVLTSPDLTSYDYNNPCDFITSTEFYITSTDYESLYEPVFGCSTTFKLPSPKLYEPPVSKLSDILSFNLTTDYTSFTIGDKISYEFITGSNGFNTTNFTASILAGGLFYNQLSEYQVGANPTAVSTTSPFISGSYSGNLILNSSLSYFKDYLFMPTGSSPIVKNSLFNNYGDVDYTFSPKAGDIISIYYPGGYFESSITDSYLNSSGSIVLALSTELPSNLNKPAYDSNTVTKFLILSKVNDETNLILTFDKKPGLTSLGFIIPNNLHPDVLANIDTITKEVKQKLIDLGTSNGGGTF